MVRHAINAYGDECSINVENVDPMDGKVRETSIVAMTPDITNTEGFFVSGSSQAKGIAYMNGDDGSESLRCTTKSATIFDNNETLTNS